MRLPVLVLLLVAASVVSACNEDVYRPRAACLDDSECVAPRFCADGACVDPDGFEFDTAPDGGDVDAPDVADADATPDDAAPNIPPPPPPASCVRAEPRQVRFSTIRPGERSERLVRVENCGLQPLDLRVGPAQTPIEVSAADPATIGPGEEALVRVALSSPVPVNVLTDFEIDAGDAGIVRVEVHGEVSDTPVLDGPVLTIDPPAIAFGAIPQGTRETRPVLVCNRGGSPLVVDDIVGAGRDAAVFDITPRQLRVDAGDCAQVEVGFDGPPISTQPAPLFSTAFEFVSNSVEPSPTLLVEGTVRTGGTPFCLEAVEAPPEVVVGLGEISNVGLLLINCSDRALRVLDVRLNGDREFAELVDAAPGPGQVLAPGEPLEATVELFGREPGAFEWTLQVETDLGTTTVPLVLVVRDAIACPTLDPGGSTSIRGPFSASTTAVVGQTVYLDAGLVGDGPGEVAWIPDEYPALPPRIETTAFRNRVQFEPTATGEYRFEVRYFGDDACTAQAVVVVSVTRDSGVGEGLRFVITWRTPGDPEELEDPGSDVDMHLIPADARARWNSDNDCYYANRETAWGGRLLRDELDGLGPEIIVLEEPELDRNYLLGVYYYSDDGFGPSDVTLRVFRDGVQIATATRRLERTGRFWLAAEVLSGGTEIVLPDTANRDEFP